MTKRAWKDQQCAAGVAQHAAVEVELQADEPGVDEVDRAAFWHRRDAHHRCDCIVVHVMSRAGGPVQKAADRRLQLRVDPKRHPCGACDGLIGHVVPRSSCPSGSDHQGRSRGCKSVAELGCDHVDVVGKDGCPLQRDPTSTKEPGEHSQVAVLDETVEELIPHEQDRCPDLLHQRLPPQTDHPGPGDDHDRCRLAAHPARADTSDAELGAQVVG